VKAIEFDNVTMVYKSFGVETVALEDVNVGIEEGEIVGLLGPNGAGKTTFLDLIIGFYIPTRGEVRVFGKNVVKHPEVVRKYVRIPLARIYTPRMKAIEVLKATAEYYGVRDYKEDLNKLIEIFDLQDHLHKQFQQLSAGNKKKIEIIGALIQKPKILLLDEVTNGLDVPTVEELVKQLKEINHIFGTTIVFASHIMEHVEMLCRRVIILNRRILADGEINELKRIAGAREYLELRLSEGIELKDLKIPFVEDVVKISEKEYSLVCLDASEALVNLTKILAQRGLLKYVEKIDVKKVTLKEVFSYFASRRKE